MLRKIHLVEQPVCILMVSHISGAVRITVDNDRRSIFKAKSKHLPVVRNRIYTGTGRIQRTVVQLQKHMMFFCRSYKRIVIDRYLPSSGCPIMFTAGFSIAFTYASYSLPLSPADAGRMHAGYDYIHPFQQSLFHIELPAVIHNIDFRSEQHFYPYMVRGNTFKFIK